MSVLKVRILGAVVGLGLLAVLGRLGQLQVLQGEAYAREAAARIRRIELIEAPRGHILDRKGRILAEDQSSYELWVDPSQAAGILADRTGAARLDRLLAESGFPGSLEPLSAMARRWEERHPGRRRVSEGERRRWVGPLPERAVYWLACRQDEHPGLSLERRLTRRYPFGSLAAHVVGFTGRLDARDLERLRGEGRDLDRLVAQYGRGAVLLDADLRERGLFRDDTVGQRGIEAQAEDRLRGRRGVRVVTVDLEKGRRREESQIEPAVPGRDVHLTLDLAVQRAAEEALGGRRGAVVALDPRTGEILALASAPAFDPGRIRLDYARLSRDPGQPLLDRAVRGTYPPGSIFKLVTAAAWLESGQDPAEPFRCEGALFEGPTRYGCDGIHGAVDFLRALEVSCNVYFFRAGKRIGPRALAARARAFGYGKPTGLSLGGEELGGSVPEIDAMNQAVGQGRLLVTPLQAAVMVSAFARGGDPARPVLEPVPREPLPPAVQSGALAQIREGMRRVVLSGTASHAGLAPFRVLGKTGTAQVGRSSSGPSPHAWFVGYGPAEAPTLAVAVVVEHGGGGGEVAAPVAAAVFRAHERGHAPEPLPEPEPPEPEIVG